MPHLERHPEQGGPVERVALEKLPFTIGRSETANYTLYSGPVSKFHASILEVEGRYAVRDLESTNGTFVNGTRIDEQFLMDGDIIHVAHVEFCFRQQPDSEVSASQTFEPALDQTQVLALDEPAASLIRGAALLRDLIVTGAAEVVYEPIVDLRTREVIGFEALSRGTLPELPSAPGALLSLAEQCGMAVKLSEMFRRLCVERSGQVPHGPKLFLNVHAREVDDPAFAASLSALPVPDGRRIVLEIAESSVTSTELMANHRAAFAALGFEFAYDDFGAGYARLIELTDVPPTYLKLDRSLVDGIEAQPRQDMIAAFVGVAQSLGVHVIAEGIETERAAETCSRLGCSLGQGYLFRPRVSASGRRRPTKRPVSPRRAKPKRSRRPRFVAR